MDYLLNAVLGVANEFFKLYIAIAPSFLLALFLVGLVNVFISQNFVMRQVSKNNISSVFKAAIFGVPLPLCSCSTPPVAKYLKSKGASSAAVIAFLISTPLTGIDSIVITFFNMGWVFAVYKPLTALLMGVIAGLIVKAVEKKDDDKQMFNEIKVEEKVPFLKKVYASFSYSFGHFFDDMIKDLAIGMIFASLISYFLPDDIFSSLGGGLRWVGYVAMLVIGLPMYVCATESIPIVITFMIKGISPGAAFVFLTAGPISNISSWALTYNILKKKNFIVYMFSATVLSIIFGIILDFIFDNFNLNYTLNSIYKYSYIQSELGIFDKIIIGVFTLLVIKAIIVNIIEFFHPELHNAKHGNDNDEVDCDCHKH